MRQEIWFDKVHGYHYAAPTTAGYSLLIVHGVGGHGGTYDVFCEPLSQRGVNVVSIDLPGHGLARNPRGNFRFEQWLEDIDTAATAMVDRWGLPVFILGSSQGSAAAFHSLDYSSAISGAITMCLILTEVPPEPDDDLAKRFTTFRSAAGRTLAGQVGDDERIDLSTALDWNKNYAANDPDILSKKRQDPLRAWDYGFASLASYFTYVPAHSASANTKPVLVTVGENDPLFSLRYIKACFEAIGGPAKLEIIPGATHQLMLYHTQTYVPLVDGWVRDQLSELSLRRS